MCAVFAAFSQLASRVLEDGRVDWIICVARLPAIFVNLLRETVNPGSIMLVQHCIPSSPKLPNLKR